MRVVVRKPYHELINGLATKFGGDVGEAVNYILMQFALGEVVSASPQTTNQQTAIAAASDEIDDLAGLL